MTLRACIKRSLKRKMVAFTLVSAWAVSVYELPQLLGFDRFGA